MIEFEDWMSQVDQELDYNDTEFYTDNYDTFDWEYYWEEGWSIDDIIERFLDTQGVWIE